MVLINLNNEFNKFCDIVFKICSDFIIDVDVFNVNDKFLMVGK